MDLVFEIGTEELPPAFVRQALDDLGAHVGKALGEAAVEFAGIRTIGTPRRLALIVTGLAPKARDSRETVFGPPAKAAFDGSGKPTKAAEGFARSQGVDVSCLKTADKDKGSYVCVEKTAEGRPTVDLIGPVLTSALDGGIRFPRTMRWESEGRRFARPVRWMTLVADGKALTTTSGKSPVVWAGVTAAGLTRGHRFLGEQEIHVVSPEQYVQVLERNGVIADHEERKRLIKEKIGRAAAAVGGLVVADDDLLERVTFTVEYPLAMTGSYDGKFLRMPREVIVTALKEHQDFFSVADAGGRLMAHFVAVANTDQDKAGKIKSGNERVLRARLEDAYFYWGEDLKAGLDAMAGRLAQVVWQEQLGTLADKTQRLASLARLLAKLLGIGRPDRIERAAILSKADLTSLMVREKEFTSLQGIMGREYAKALGEDGEVADAIFEHYLPRFAGDRLPETETGTVLALADKIDSLVGYFGIGLAPTGSADPYGLRRQATGVVRVLLEKGLHLHLDSEAIRAAVDLYGNALSTDKAKVVADVWLFLRQRLETLLVDSGGRRDTVASVLGAEASDDPALVALRLAAVSRFETDERFGRLVTAFKRARNITLGAEVCDVDDRLFEDDAEAHLYKKYSEVLPKFTKLIDCRQFAEAMHLLLELSHPIDVFFDKVMVMVDDEVLRRNRLSLLGLITDLFMRIADFSKMEVG